MEDWLYNSLCGKIGRLVDVVVGVVKVLVSGVKGLFD